MTLILSGTDGLSDVDGSAATPAIRGTDANTGIFFGADIIGFSEGGTEVARFNADAQFVAAAGTASLPVITTTGDTNTGIFFPAADTIAFSEGGVEAMRLDSAGNMGLGVTPSAWNTAWKGLQVVSSSLTNNGFNDVYLGTNFVFDSTSTSKYINSDFATLYGQVNGTHQWSTAASGTAGNAITFTQAMTLDASGYLLVGATSSDGGGASRLQVGQSGGQAQLLLKNSGGHAGFYSTGTDLYQSWASGGFLALGHAPANGSTFTEYARIDSSGNLLVGTTSSATGNTSTFQSRSATANDFGLAVIHTATDAAVRGLLVKSPNSSSDSGYLIIGARSTGDRFYVLTNGNVQNTNNSYGAISDVKLKENIVDATPKLDKLNQVRVVNYNLIGESHKQIGVIAQELEQIFPSMIEESPDRDKDGNELGTTTKSVKYSVFVPMLIKALQEQQAIITSLTDRITALENK